MNNKLLLFVFALFSFSNLHAQNSGQITGSIFDAETGETLIGVNVIIAGTAKGTATNIDGYYEINNLNPDVYTLKISYLAFETQIISGIKVESGDVVQLNIDLKPEAEILDDVTVSAKAILDSEAGLLNQRQKAVSFNNAISSESISRSGSGDAASALKKVAGASVVDGKYVYIRGLGDRYTSTQLNGSALPSADPDRKSFQLDIIPANLLENIVTVKTFTPDKPGNFSGGLINVSTKDFPERLSLQFSSSAGYNSQASFNDILIGKPSRTDFLGFDDGSREIPKAVKNYLRSGKEIPSIYEAKYDAEAAAILDELSRSFNNEFRPQAQKAVLNQSYSISFGNRSGLFGKDLGYTASITYGQSYSGSNDGIVSRYDLIGTYDNAAFLNRRLDVSRQQGSRNVDLSGMATVSYQILPNHSISAKFLKTQNGTSEGSYMEGFQLDIPDATFQTRVIKYVERELNSFQLSGKSIFPGFFNSTMEWRGSVAKNIQNEPDLRYFTTQVDTFRSGNIVHSNPTNNFPRPGRFYRDLSETNYTGAIDLSIPFNSFSGLVGKLKTGGSFIQVNRDFNELRLDIYTDEQNLRLNDVDGNENAFFDKMGIIDYGANHQPLFGNYIQDASTLRSNYDASKKIAAAYVMAELPVSDKIKVVGGVRFEHAQMSVISEDSSLEEGKLNDLDLLPAINAIFELSDNMDLRASVSRTLARPTFRELAPYITFDFVGGLLFQGNSDLKRTSILNYDIRWEYFTGSGEILAISGFYKQLANPLERVIRTDIGNDAASIQNVDRGEVYGLEFEVRKHLDFISPSLRNFTLAANLTFVSSKVDIPEMEMTVIRQARPNAENSRELQGQSPFILNLDLGYSNAKSGLHAALSYNLFGDRQALVTEGATPNVYERGYGMLNFTASKSIGQHFEFNIKASNLLDPDIKQSQFFKDQEYLHRKHKIGRTISFGVKYKI